MSAVAPPLELECRRVGRLPHALVRRLSWATFALLAAGFAALLVISLIYPDQARAPSAGTISAGLALLASMATAGAALLAQIACWIGPLARGRLSIDASGVRSSGLRTRVVSRAAIESGWIVREPDGARVELRLRNGDVLSAATASLEEATSVLDAAGVDPAHRALRMPLGGAGTLVGLGLAAAAPACCVSAIVAGLAGQVLHFPSVAVGLLMFVLVTLLVGAAVRLLAPPTVSVGNDGLAVQGGLGSWFVSFDQIASVAYGRDDVALQLRDGRARRIRTLGTSAARREALAVRIAAGVEAARAPLDLSARLTALDRNGRPAEEWRAALRRLAEGHDGYRATGLTRDEVQGALDDPRATPERRIGAAFALAAMDPALASSRVRVVVETVAYEPVRVALERAAVGEMDEETLAAAGEGRAGG